MSSDRHNVFSKLLVRARELRHKNWNRVAEAIDDQQAAFVGEGIDDTGVKVAKLLPAAMQALKRFRSLALAA